MGDVGLANSGHPLRVRTGQAADPHKAEIVELDVAIVTFPNVPEKNNLAEVVVRRLTERAGTRNGTATVVEPIAGNAPIWRARHPDLSLCDCSEICESRQPILSFCLPQLPSSGGTRGCLRLSAKTGTPPIPGRQKSLTV